MGRAAQDQRKTAKQNTVEQSKMKCRTAKEFLRPMAIEHYITNRNSNLFIFMSLYSDEEPTL